MVTHLSTNTAPYISRAVQENFSTSVTHPIQVLRRGGGAQNPTLPPCFGDCIPRYEIGFGNLFCNRILTKNLNGKSWQEWEFWNTHEVARRLIG